MEHALGQMKAIMIGRKIVLAFAVVAHTHTQAISKSWFFEWKQQLGGKNIDMYEISIN